MPFSSVFPLISDDELMFRNMCYHQLNDDSQTYTWLPVQTSDSLIQNRGRRKFEILYITVADNKWKLKSTKFVIQLLHLVHPAQIIGRFNYSL